MQAARSVMKRILPWSHFPTFLEFMNSLGSKMLPSRSIIQSPETGFYNVVQMQNLSPSSEERGSAVSSHRRKKENSRLNRILILILLTCFFGELCECLHSLLAIAALRGDGGDVGPAQRSDDVHHGLGLE